LGGEGAVENLEGVRNGNRLFVVAKGDEFQHCGYILFKTRQTLIIGENGNPPLIACCQTTPAARGRGLYRKALHAELGYLWSKGHRRAVIETSPDNLPSRRGIEAAGFRPCREVEVWILASCVVWQKVSDSWGNRRKFFFA